MTSSSKGRWPLRIGFSRAQLNGDGYDRASNRLTSTGAPPDDRRSIRETRALPSHAHEECTQIQVCAETGSTTAAGDPGC
ncbi:hypothetical protein D3C87_1028650 [compost metagenome]